MDEINLDVPGPVGDILGMDLAGNSLLAWGIALVVLVASFVVMRVARALVARRLRRVAERTTTRVDDLALELLDRTMRLFLLVVAIYAGSLALELEDATELNLKRMLAIALFVQCGVWGKRVLEFAIQKSLHRTDMQDPSRKAVITVFGFFGQVAVWSLVVLLALDNLGFDVTALVAGLGIGGVAIALALQTVLGDTIASLSIILDRPFEVGDFIIVGDLPGTVERVGIKTTRLRSLWGEQLVFGNQDLLTSRVRNFKRMYERRIMFGFGVVYSTPAAKLERIPGAVRSIIEGLDGTRFDRGHFKGFGDSSLDFEIVYYVLSPEYNRYMDLQQAINLAIVRHFEAEGIDFAFPTRTLHVRGADGPIRAEVTGVAGPLERDRGGAAGEPSAPAS